MGEYLPLLDCGARSVNADLLRIVRRRSLTEAMSNPAPANVKTGVAQFKEELMRYPMSWTTLPGSVVSATEYPRGGHFAPWEVPDLLVGDLKEFLWSDGSGFRGCGRE